MLQVHRRVVGDDVPASIISIPALTRRTFEVVRVLRERDRRATVKAEEVAVSPEQG